MCISRLIKILALSGRLALHVQRGNASSAGSDDAWCVAWKFIDAVQTGSCFAEARAGSTVRPTGVIGAEWLSWLYSRQHKDLLHVSGFHAIIRRIYR